MRIACFLIIILVGLPNVVLGAPSEIESKNVSMYKVLVGKCPHLEETLLEKNLSVIFGSKCTDWGAIDKSTILTNEDTTNIQCLLLYESLLTFCTSLGAQITKFNSLIQTGISTNFTLDEVCRPNTSLLSLKNTEHNLSNISQPVICYSVCTTDKIEGGKPVTQDICNKAYFFATFEVEKFLKNANAISANAQPVHISDDTRELVNSEQERKSENKEQKIAQPVHISDNAQPKTVPLVQVNNQQKKEDEEKEQHIAQPSHKSGDAVSVPVIPVNNEQVGKGVKMENVNEDSIAQNKPSNNEVKDINKDEHDLSANQVQRPIKVNNENPNGQSNVAAELPQEIETQNLASKTGDNKKVNEENKLPGKEPVKVESPKKNPDIPQLPNGPEKDTDDTDQNEGNAPDLEDDNRSVDGNNEEKDQDSERFGDGQELDKSEEYVKPEHGFPEESERKPSAKKEKPSTLDEDPVNNYNLPVDEMDGDSYFFSYFSVLMCLVIVGYVGYHNRQKVLALLLEGKRGKRGSRTGRRPNSANYHKLDSNLEEAMSSSCTKNSSNVIY